MTAQALSVEMDLGGVRGGVEAESDALAVGQAPRQRECALVDDPTVVGAQVLDVALFIVGAGHRHRQRVGQRVDGPFHGVDVRAGGAEVPYAVQAERQAVVVGLRIQHGVLLAVNGGIGRWIRGR